MKNKHHYVAIMAGGIGSRFWPMSRTSFPKQFLDVLNTGKTLIQWTYDRYTKFIPEENIFIVTSEEYVAIVKKQLPNLPVENILAEPSKKNTAPCIAYISFKLAQIDPEACFIVAPSDHLILEQDNFEKISLQALDFVANIKALATLVSAFFIAIARTPEVARPKRGYSDSGDHFAFRASVTKATPEALGSDTAAAATI